MTRVYSFDGSSVWLERVQWHFKPANTRALPRKITISIAC